MPTTKPRPARRPRPDDVARWVAIVATPIPSYYGGAALSAMRRERDHARSQLSSWGLDAQGNATQEMQS